jgi:hypothetical protein
MIEISSIGMLSMLRAMVESIIWSISALAFWSFLSIGSRGINVCVRCNSSLSAKMEDPFRSNGMNVLRDCENPVMISAGMLALSRQAHEITELC